MSQEELGKRVGFAKGGIADFEWGFVDFYYEHAVMFAEVFGLDPEIFIDDYTRFCTPGYGKRIKKIRAMYGMTQQEFAAMLGCDRANESVWESEIDNRHPRRDMYLKLRKLAADIGIDMDKLIDNPDLYIDEYTVFVGKDWGKKIRRIRLVYGLPLSDFSAIIGCDEQTLEHWELEYARPTRAFYSVIKEAASNRGIDLDALNEDPTSVSCEYLSFISAECGRKIHSIRMAYGVTLKQFGKMIGCTGEAVAKWENGACTPNLQYYQAISKVANDKCIPIVRLNENPALFQDDYAIFCERDYGKIVKRIRKAWGMWQDAFAEKLHVSLSTVSNWETQRAQPTRENYVLLKQIASEKGINIYDA